MGDDALELIFLFAAGRGFFDAAPTLKRPQANVEQSEGARGRAERTQGQGVLHAPVDASGQLQAAEECEALQELLGGCPAEEGVAALEHRVQVAGADALCAPVDECEFQGRIEPCCL